MKFRPNDPCPCGSGRKYKKCHGSLSISLSSLRQAEANASEWLARGKQNQHLGKIEEAEECFQRAIKLSPSYADAWLALGELAEWAGDFIVAGQCYSRAVELQPRNAQIHFLLGNIHAQQYAFERALLAYRTAISLQPKLPGVWGNLGNVEKYLGRFPEAMTCYRNAVELEADLLKKSRLHSHFLFSLHYDESLSHEALFRAHVEWAERYAKPLLKNGKTWSNELDPSRILKIGYVSGSFNGHIMSHFLKGVLACHDPSKFSIYLFSSTRVEDENTQVLRRYCHEWVDIGTLDDNEAAIRIQSCEIDIVVDLDSHTQNGRPLIFARKPAPVQVEWLDYFDTSGMDCVDYIITDPYTTPFDSTQGFSETPVRLPATRFNYSPPDYAPPVVSAPCLTKSSFTFGSFNRQDKLHPELLGVWAKILLQVQDSQLLIKNRALQVPAVRQSLRDTFARLGVSSERLILSDPSTHAEMLAEYGEVDMALDTFPYNGGLTTCECLWMGVPIVALEAERMIGRQTSAILRLLKLDDWVAGSLEEYIQLAVDKSNARQALGALRFDLRERMAGSLLCDSPRFTRSLEAAYRTMWERYCQNKLQANAESTP